MASQATTRVEVLIVGGGMVGLSLAAALGGAGVAVALIDRESAETLTDADYDGRASAIAAGSRDVLAGIGVWAAIAPAAEPILEIRVSDGTSPLFLHYDSDELGEGPLGYMVENRRTRVILIDHLSRLDAVRLMNGCAVVSLERTATTAQATLDNGRRIRADLVVAADGRDSPLRATAGIGCARWDYPQTGIVCTVAHERPHRGIAQEHFLPAGPFAILPLTGNRSSIVWTERAALAPSIMALGENDFTAELGLRFGDYLGALTPLGMRFSYPLGLVHAERYVAERLALAGDAAHAIHPIAGQGFNLGLRDVAALAETVVDALRLGLDPGATTALAGYERWRRFDNLVMLAATDGLNRLFSNDAAPLRHARDLGLAAVGHVPPLKRFLMRHAMGRTGELPRLARGLPL